MTIDLTSHRHLPGLVVASLGAIGLFAASQPAHAISCGDTLDGGTWELTEDLDCSTWPLPPQGSPVLTLKGPVEFDLGDNTIICPVEDDGTLAVPGIQVDGSEAHVHDGTLRNCRRGLVVSGQGNHLLKRLTVTSDPGLTAGAPIGFAVESDHNRLMRNTVEAFAGEGFRVIGGNTNLFKYNRATHNGDHGFRVKNGRGNVFLWNEALSNVGEGFRSQDRDTRFEHNVANYNGDEGFRLRDATAQNNRIVGNTAKYNGLSPCNPLGDNPDVNPGIAITREAGSTLIKNNNVKNNCIGIGIEKGSQGNKIERNKSRKNRLVDMVDGHPKCKGNKWRRNEFLTGATGNFPPGNPFALCLRSDDLVSKASDQAKKVVDGGKSAAKKAGSAVKDAIDSVF